MLLTILRACLDLQRHAWHAASRSIPTNCVRSSRVGPAVLPRLASHGHMHAMTGLAQGFERCASHVNSMRCNTKWCLPLNYISQAVWRHALRAVHKSGTAAQHAQVSVSGLTRVCTGGMCFVSGVAKLARTSCTGADKRGTQVESSTRALLRCVQPWRGTRQRGGCHSTSKTMPYTCKSKEGVEDGAWLTRAGVR